MNIKYYLFAFLLFIFSSISYSSTIYLQAKNYLDVENGKLIQPANILIQNGVIQAINPASVPSDATIVKRPTLTLLPGLMDMHVHLSMDFDSQFPLRYAQEDAAMSTTRGVKNAEKLLKAGFTTVRNLGVDPSESFVDVALSKASEAGWITAPHIIPAGHALSITGGHLDPGMFGAYAPGVLPTSYRTGVADGVDEVVKATRYQIKHGAKVIKVAATAGILSLEESLGAQQFSYEELKAIVTEANRHNVPVTAHAHGTDGIKAAVKAGVKSIEHGSILDAESISLMKQYGTYLVPTVYVKTINDQKQLNPLILKKRAEIIPLATNSLKMAIQANVKMAFGTDSGVFPHGDNAREFAALVNSGLSSLNAIQTATIHAAQLANLKNSGQIKVGYHADVIGVSENPVENIRTLENVQFVMKDGNIVKG